MSKLEPKREYVAECGRHVLISGPAASPGQFIGTTTGNDAILYNEEGEVVGGTTGMGMNIVDVVSPSQAVIATMLAPPAKNVPTAPHPKLPHEDMLQAVLADRTVQYKDDEGMWHDLRSKAYALRYILQSADDAEFRVRPETETVWLPVFEDGTMGPSYLTMSREGLRAAVAREQAPIKYLLRIVRERATLRVLSFEHETPDDHSRRAS